MPVTSTLNDATWSDAASVMATETEAVSSSLLLPLLQAPSRTEPTRASAKRSLWLMGRFLFSEAAAYHRLAHREGGEILVGKVRGAGGRAGRGPDPGSFAGLQHARRLIARTEWRSGAATRVCGVRAGREIVQAMAIASLEWRVRAQVSGWPNPST